MMGRRIVIAAALIALVFVTACGGDDDGAGNDDTPGPPTPRAGLDATEETLLASLSGLGQYVLTPADVPEGYRSRSNSPVSKREAAVANVGITVLSNYINGSDLQGVWATLMTREDPEAGLSSLIYAFGTPESAQGFVQTLANLQQADYPASASVDRVDSEKIEDSAQMMSYRIAGSGDTPVSARTLEYSWSQGRFAGQVIIRYPGDVSNPDDIPLLISLAKLQAERMRALPQ
jgi:hypothetical protein